MVSTHPESFRDVIVRRMADAINSVKRDHDHGAGIEWSGEDCAILAAVVDVVAADFASILQAFNEADR